MFDLDDYKAVLRTQIDRNRSVRGYQKKLSEACRCHTSFISQVINSHLHLTPDHAADMCVFWGFNDLQTDYYSTLVEYNRAS